MLSEQQTQTLEQLSAAADKGPLKHGMSFLAALETAYRTGQLVAVQPDDATVERVARAICKARYLNGGDASDDGWDECPPRMKDDYREQATAAIAAMKGPKP